MKVIKRDGTIVDYDRSKIVTAIEKANQEVPEADRIDRESIDAIIDEIEAMKRPRMLVEDIQDLVEQGLVAKNKFHLAKTYIIYRYNRALVRKANTTDESILALLRNENKELAEARDRLRGDVKDLERDNEELTEELKRQAALGEQLKRKDAECQRVAREKEALETQLGQARQELEGMKKLQAKVVVPTPKLEEVEGDHIHCGQGVWV